MPVVVTGLVLAGVGLLVAVSPTTFGDAIRGPVLGAVTVVEAAKALWELTITTVFTGAVVWWLVDSVRRGDRGGVAGALLVLAFSVGTTVVMRLFWPSAFDAAWEEYAEPIRYVVRLF